MERGLKIGSIFSARSDFHPTCGTVLDRVLPRRAALVFAVVPIPTGLIPNRGGPAKVTGSCDWNHIIKVR